MTRSRENTISSQRMESRFIKNQSALGEVFSVNQCSYGGKINGKNDLIERYIYAVTKHMKSAMQKDVAAELETIIQDMLEERCGDVIPAEHDIKVVLTELGTPAELASKYKGEIQACLIGQPYYSLYVYVLKIVTACIIGGMLLAQIMAAIMSHTIWYMAIYQTIGGILGGTLTGFAFVTLLFAFFYKKGIKVEGLNDGVDNLPPVPQKTNRISKADAIVGIIFSVIFTLIFLVCPQIICIAFVKMELRCMNRSSIWNISDKPGT